MSAPLNIWLAWRAAAGGRMARVSLAVRIVGVAFATLLLLLAAASDNALDHRGDRITWRSNWDLTGYGPDDAWLQVDWANDYYLGDGITRVYVAQLAPEAEVPPGLPRIPQAGEVFLSPALERLIAEHPDELAGRYGDSVVGTITDDGLASSDELVAITGYAPEVLNGAGLSYRELPTGFHQSGVTMLMRIVVIVGVVVLLFPIAMFIAAAARLNAQESDARLAAFRLAGADPARVRWIVAWESVLSAVPGMLLGLGLFFIARTPVAQVEFDSASFMPSDFALGWLSMLVLALVPMVVVAASFVGLRDVEISPLGVSRQSRPRSVRPLGFLLLVPGFALLWLVLGNLDSALPVLGLDPSIGLVVAILLILFGVALTGTWLGQFAARLLVTRVNSGAMLLALRRIVADPHASFRTVAGVTFAVFAGTLFLSLTAALEREAPGDPISGVNENVILADDPDGASSVPDGLPSGAVVVPMRMFGADTDTGEYVRVHVGECSVLANVLPIEGDCDGRIAIRDGSGLQPGDVIRADWLEPPLTITVPDDVATFRGPQPGAWGADLIVPPGFAPAVDTQLPGALAVLPPPGVTAGDPEFEQVRTALIRATPLGYVSSAQEYDANASGAVSTMRNLVYAGTLGAFAFSGGTAAMTVGGSIIARRRSFALLRMSGCSLGTLRRTVMTEATVPLVLVSLVAAATAVGVSALMIWKVGEGSVLPPPAFALPLLGGLALGIALPLMTLPLLGTVTRLDQTRFE